MLERFDNSDSVAFAEARANKAFLEKTNRAPLLVEWAFRSGKATDKCFRCKAFHDKLIECQNCVGPLFWRGGEWIMDCGTQCFAAR